MTKTGDPAFKECFTDYIKPPITGVDPIVVDVVDTASIDPPPTDVGSVTDGGSVVAKDPNLTNKNESADQSTLDKSTINNKQNEIKKNEITNNNTSKKESEVATGKVITNDNNETNKNNNNNQTAMIAGIISAVLLVITIVAVCIYMACKDKEEEVNIVDVYKNGNQQNQSLFNKQNNTSINNNTPKLNKNVINNNQNQGLNHN